MQYLLLAFFFGFKDVDLEPFVALFPLVDLEPLIDLAPFEAVVFEYCT